MSTRLLVFIWAMFTLSSTAQPLLRASNSPAVQAPETARAALDPWLRAVEGVLSKTKDAEVDLYLRVLRNPALMVPTGEAGPNVLAQRVLVPPPNTAGPWIGIVVIEANESLPSGRWQQLASTSDFAAEYHEDTNTIYLRSDIPQIPIIRGLLVLHEMRHWRQAGHPGSTEDPDFRLRREVDAYETEFRILDALLLPGYQELLMSERLRIRRVLADPKQPPIQPELDSPLLEKTFGGFANPIAKQMAAAEIAVRAAFAEFDTLPAAKALRRKIDLLHRLGY